MKVKRKKKVINQELRILAIDPAQNLGWAMGRDLYGNWDLRTRKDESWGMKLIRLRHKLIEIHTVYKLDLIVYERPGGQYGADTVSHSKLVGIIEEFCEQNHIDYRAFSATEIKKFATGKGNSGKAKMVEAAQQKLGYTGTNDNEADALWLLKLIKDTLGTK